MHLSKFSRRLFLKSESVMKIIKSTIPAIQFIAVFTFLLALGCASTPEDASARKMRYPTADSILKEGDVKKTPPTVYQHPIEEVRPAAARALSFVGCKVDTQEDFFVSGKRPQKMGLFVGSGGETVKLFLYPQSPSETHVWVDTDLSFVGIAGQQGWNKQVLEELTRILDKPQSASAK
jgi:hypothetical protein